MRIVKSFQAHPASVGESYFGHMRTALGFAAALTRAAAACCVHAFLPFPFQKTGSGAIEDLHRRMIRDRGLRTGNRQGATDGLSSAAT
jgi:hypothetical protein